MTPSEKRREGLDESEVGASREKYGKNVFVARGQRGFWRLFLSNLGDPVIKVLLLALVLHVLLLFRDPDWIETTGIACSVVLATVISTLSQYKGERAFSRLQESCGVSRCRVRRRRVLEIEASEIVVGDVVLLGAGEKIPADGMVIWGEVTVDQSALTGESRELAKRRASPCEACDPTSEGALLAGCSVLSGEAEMQVLRVGERTMLGGISGELQGEKRESPLRLRLSRLAGQISRIGYAAAAFCALAYLFNVFCVDVGFDQALMLSRVRDVTFLAESLLHAFTLALTVVVVAVPEGLPMMIAVVLSSNIRRMVRDNVLVRKPEGLEAAGSMNVLFTDKTGTSPQFEVFLIIEDASPIGYMTVQHGTPPLLYSLYLLPAHQHRGIGRLAFNRMRDFCITNAQSCFLCHCQPENTNALTFYQHMGGVIIARDEDNVETFMNSVTFRFMIPKGEAL